MKTNFLLLCLCFVATPIWASAGLTSAGVDPNTNTTQNDPTLAQVAPVQNGTVGTTASAVPGTIAGGAPVAVPGAANGAAGTVANGAAGNAANGNAATTATTAVVQPPPPADPSTLPVSVIHPLNHAAGDPAAAVNPATVTTSTDETVTPRERRPPAPAAVPASRPFVNASPTTPANRINAAQSRAEPARTAADAPAEETVDTSSGSYVFYTGTGLAGVILLLSIGSFLRSRNEESGAAPRV
jgi:hypothetical protein